MTDADQHSEKRRLHRHTLATAADVYDRISQSFLGRVVNLHAEGLMIFGNHAFTAERIYQLDLHLPSPLEGRRAIPIGVECLWTQGDDAERSYWAGCRIIDISDDALTDLRALIAQYGDKS